MKTMAETLFAEQKSGYDKDQVDRFIQKLTGEFDKLRCQYDEILRSQERQIKQD